MENLKFMTEFLLQLILLILEKIVTNIPIKGNKYYFKSFYKVYN